MNQEALLRAKPGVVQVQGKGRATPFADTIYPLDVSVPASPRAVFHLSPYGSLRHELNTAVGARPDSAGVTDKGGGGSRIECLPAVLTHLLECGVRKRPVLDQIGVCLPEGYLFNTVAAVAERHKVVERVRVPVVTEQVKRALVMHRERTSMLAASLACMTIALSGEHPLHGPVFSPVLGVTAAPRAVVRSSELTDSPRAKARTRAKVVGADGAWLLAECLATLGACHVDHAFIIPGLACDSDTGGAL